MKVPGVPFDQGRHPQGSLKPTAVVLHRTYGSLTADGFKGAYSIGKNGRSGVGIGFHFLIGKNEGQWAQFYDTTAKAAHAKGASDWSIGIEFDGVNEGPLTDWQIRAGAWVLALVADAHGISLDGYSTAGPRRRVNGVLPHSLVPGSDHTDLVTETDYAKMLKLIRAPQPTITEDDMYVRNQENGDIYAFSATHYHHLTGPEWADRQDEKPAPVAPNVHPLQILKAANAGRVRS